jgi:hypothetical protein
VAAGSPADLSTLWEPLWETRPGLLRLRRTTVRHTHKRRPATLDRRGHATDERNGGIGGFLHTFRCFGLVLALCVSAVLARDGRAAHAYPTPPTWWLHQASCIAYAESRNNAHERSNPTYRGLFQFEWGTWASVGGVGDPANASGPEQTYRAWLVYRRDGCWCEWSTRTLCGLT